MTANKDNIDTNKLAHAKKLLEARGFKPRDYNHLPYKEILKLAGVANDR